jgi:hypothetical protein
VLIFCLAELSWRPLPGRVSVPHGVNGFGSTGTAIMTGRLQLLSPEQGAGGGSGEELFRGGALFAVAPTQAMIGPCLPDAAPSNVGAVHHDMSPDAHAIRRTGLLFFCGAPGQPWQP